MVNSILCTFDADNIYPHNNTVRRFFCDVASFFSQNAALNISILKNFSNFYRDLFAHARNYGIEVRVLDVPQVFSEKGAGTLEQQLEASELVFHSHILTGQDLRRRGIDISYRRTIEEYVAAHKARTHSIDGEDKLVTAVMVNNEGIPIPKTQEAIEYLASDQPLPVVLKAKIGCGGRRVYYIDSPRQLEIFFSRWKNYVARQDPPDPKDYIVQEVIETPSSRFTSYRVVSVGARILGAVLNISQETKDCLERKVRYFSDVYDTPFSPLYLGCYPIASNVYSGGFQIPVSHQPAESLSEEYMDILHVHRIDPYAMQIPEKLKQLVQRTGAVLSQNGILLAAQDWIQDRNGNFYFLEANSHMGLRLFNVLFMQGMGTFCEYRSIGFERIAMALKEYS